MAVRSLNWDEIINEDDDDENWADPRVPSSGRSHPGHDNDNDNGQGQKDTQSSEKGTGKENGRKDEKRKGMGKGKGNGKGNDILKNTPRGEDISRAVAWQLQNEMYKADLDTKGFHEQVNLEPEASHNI
jgi:hypothetical protein